MPIEVNWYLPTRILHARAWGRIHPDELDPYTDTCEKFLLEALANSDKLVYLVMNGLEIESLPPVYVLGARGMPVIRMKNRGPMFFVTENRAIRTIVELTAHVTRFSLQVFTTEELAFKAAEAVMVRDDVRLSTQQIR